jgi:SWI/SNF-related matrix-associated actin-dependent regulator 1 of chromatin subfamily A
MTTILRPFQEEGVAGIYRFRGKALLADECGLGKTIQALAWISRIPKRRPVLIICPASLKYMWQFEAWSKFRLRARVIEGQGPKRNRSLVLQDDILIINYDILHHWQKVILRRSPSVVILDEVHYAKNKEAQRTKAARHVSQDATSVVGLSGTPMTNKPIELWSVLNIIRPDLWPDFSEFAWRYCKPRHTFWGWKFDGAEHRGELFSILKESVMIRRLKKDVAPELPDKIHKVIPFKLDSHKQKEYRRATENFIIWLKEKSPAKANRARRAQAVVKVGYLFRLCCELKMNQTIAFLRDFIQSNPGQKAVAMTGHTFVIERLVKEFPNSVVVNGAITGKARTEAVRRFTTQPASKITFLFGNWKAAGTGLNLQVAHNLFVLDPPWTPGDLLQGQDRVHRIDQKEIVIIWYLLLFGTVEHDWMEILRKRTVVLKEILDGEKAATEEDLFGKLLDKLTKQ